MIVVNGVTLGPLYIYIYINGLKKTWLFTGVLFFVFPARFGHHIPGQASEKWDFTTGVVRKWILVIYCLCQNRMYLYVLYIVLMEEILHHLGCKKPCTGINYQPQPVSRISFINSNYILSRVSVYIIYTRICYFFHHGCIFLFMHGFRFIIILMRPGSVNLPNKKAYTKWPYKIPRK